jgi:hypothetical protein
MFTGELDADAASENHTEAGLEGPFVFLQFTLPFPVALFGIVARKMEFALVEAHGSGGSCIQKKGTAVPSLAL